MWLVGDLLAWHCKMAENPEAVESKPQETKSPSSHVPATEQEKKAQGLMEQADKKVQSASSFMGKMFG